MPRRHPVILDIPSSKIGGDEPGLAPKSLAPLIIYIRVSKVGDREGESFRSPKEQEDRARSWAESKGYAVGAVVKPLDLDVSGAVHPRDRPGMAWALEEIRAGRAGGLTAFSIDRYSRDPAHGDWLVQEITSHGGILTAPDMPEDLDSPTGEFTFGMLLQVARLYRRTAGARFQSAQKAATLAGIAVGPVPLGYRQIGGEDGEDRRLEVDPETAPLVREMFEARAGGYGWRRIAKLMTEKGGRRFTSGTIPERIANPLYYTGRIQFGGVISEHDAGAIVDSATWYAAQKPAGRGRISDGRWLLTGLLKCEDCGHNMRPWKPSSKQKSAYRYRCDNDECPGRVSVQGPVTESLVMEEAFRADLKLVEKPDAGPDLDLLEQELEGAERRFQAIQTPEVQDGLGDAWPAALRDRREDRDAAAAALAEGRLRAGPNSSGKVYRLGHIWDDLDPIQQRQALQWTFEKVLVHKVPRGDQPKLTFVPRTDTIPYGASILYQPVTIERV